MLCSPAQAALLPMIAASRDALAAIDPELDAEQLQVQSHVFLMKADSASCTHASGKPRLYQGNTSVETTW